MFVPTFNEQDIQRELEADFASVMHASNAVDHKFRRFVLKSKRYPVRVIQEYNSPKRNKWLVFYEAKHKRAVGDNTHIAFVCVAHSDRGYYAFYVFDVIDDNRLRIAMYPPHFFQRYSDRARVDKHGIELIKHFFQHNNGFRAQIDGSHLRATCAEGMCLGRVSEHSNFLFKTFLSPDILREDQAKQREHSEDLRKKVHGG